MTAAALELEAERLFRLVAVDRLPVDAGAVAKLNEIVRQAYEAGQRNGLDEVAGCQAEFVADLLKNASDEWDADEAAEAIAIRYVRCLEAVAERTLGRLPEPGDYEPESTGGE